MRPTALVTGGGRGIGAATAETAARAGYDVALAYRADKAAALLTADRCRTLGSRALVVQADVSLEDDVLAMFSAVADEFGGLDAVVNNAGTLDQQTRVENLTTDRVRRILDVNVLGTLLCCREAVRLMSTDRGGRGGAIVNVSSRAAVLGGAGEYVDYAASKAAVDAITVGLAHEVADLGIRVNGVRPGLIETDLHKAGGEPGRVARLAPTVPMQRGGGAAEVAEAIVWLMGGKASYVTGTTIDVAGGR